MSSVKNWIQASRLRTLPLALSSIFMGSAFIPANRHFFAVLALASLTTLFLQVLSNLANDFGDFQNGADNAQRVGPSRAVQTGAISIQSMKIGIGVMATMSFISGCSLLLVSFGLDNWPMLLVFLAFGLLAIGAAFKYTAGKNPYGYRALGDLSVFIFFGILGVLGTHYLHKSEVPLSALLLAIAIGFLAASVLNLNNLRDIENDGESGKKTIPVLLGFSKGKIYHCFLMSSAWIAIIGSTLILDASKWTYLVLLVLPIHLLHLKKVWSTAEPSLIDPELKKIALTTFLISLVFLISGLL